MSQLPWLTIPDAAQPGQPHAFADREAQLCSLYRALVHAGNAVRDGRTNIRHKHVVHGYMGVGKSALILQTLGLLRREITIGDPGQCTEVHGALQPEPKDPQRWLIFHLSGKHIADIEALGEELAITSRQALEESTRSTLDLARTISKTAERDLPQVTRLPLIDVVLRKNDNDLYKKVEQALEALIHTLNYVTAWRGGMRTDKSVKTEGVERQSLKNIKAELEARYGKSGKAGAAGLATAASLIYKHGATLSTEFSSEVERKWRVDAGIVTDALNEFFHATDHASLPTLLVLDDFDEFASAIGPSHERRARILATILGPFQKLAPTCLVIGLRAEYLHEDIRRQYDETHVPAMARSQFARAVDAWREMQEPRLPDEQVQALNALTRRVLEGFDHVDGYDHDVTPIAIPFQLLRIIRHLATSGASIDKSPSELLTSYVRDKLPLQAQRALTKIVDQMPSGDILACAAALPLEPEPYDVSTSERRVLEKAGLVRPAMASDPDDPTIVIDPLAAYLKAATLIP